MTRPRRPGRLSRALPALLRIGWNDAIAYRSELVVWMLTMTVPLIMLALFRAVAAEGAIGGFDAPAFTAYFLAALTVRQLASSWVVYELNREIREGSLAMHLLRPIHPLWAYLAATAAAIPLRAIVSVPISLGLLYAIEGGVGSTLARTPLAIAFFLASLFFAFLIAFCFSALVGTLALYFESALGIWLVYHGLFVALSGYLVPLELFPPWLRHLAEATPFPSLQAFPVELLLGRVPMQQALHGLGRQAIWAVASGTLLLVVWHHAQKRFATYGG
jgi:ABC-2 type transport system permease protein